ncbi:hypothetical protein LMOSLCC2482_0156 [Listeria monocytogenes serotype 7 str. SLCC2482]|nr:hypothetical protein LMOSLCC2482_0156 [Listeria monocytogenes serotype 7 str. SLCC2482]CBY47747.1 hypothetical protein LMOSLCC2755_0155 [Listeria monocytogenes SLCC2755]CBY66232.1 hypothetical protein LMOL312_0154 [Listeria monocytogenes L312]CBY69064.1 hypothetical protein LMOATCC19117_0165 [Listeria monocytogenes ATCC 19117]CBY71935.1 hypothetical protein LMOSLCC2378_0168 [Listeria monocytogenes SLCC2378]CBY74799.1 hypothetical protein LMOSLCC2540_0158 [Listeria monocytogenes SLCC2540]
MRIAKRNHSYLHKISYHGIIFASSSFFAKSLT